MKVKQFGTTNREQIKLGIVIAFFLLSGIAYGGRFGFSGEAFRMGEEEAEMPGIREDAAVFGEELLGKVNINTADEDELARLSGIGEKTAAAIAAFRTENGVFRQIEEIMDVPGIGEKTFERIKEDITVE